jgi:ribosome-interacting GTPase 1
MPANASPEFSHAEKKFDTAKTDEDRILALEEMIRTMPQHKSAESLRSNLRTRYKKLKEKMETKGKGSKGGGGKPTIKKEEIQAIICGLPNTGKSYLFKTLTGQEAFISDIAFSTYEPIPAMMNFENTQTQIIDMPPFPNEDKSLINNADTLLITLNDPSQIQESEKYLQRSMAKKIYIFTKTDLLNEAEKRKLEANLKSKYKNIDYFLFSNINHTSEELKHLKQKIFSTFPIIRVFTKQPKKEAGLIPMIMQIGATTSDVAEKILKGMSKRLKTTRIWGPSSKFPGQLVGKDHVLKDKDVVEFQTE